MRKAIIQAKVKKIEINNRVLSDGCTQTIRIILDDIALSDDMLTCLRQFRPGELVNVDMTPTQDELFDEDKIKVFSFTGEGQK